MVSVKIPGLKIDRRLRRSNKPGKSISMLLKAKPKKRKVKNTMKPHTLLGKTFPTTLRTILEWSGNGVIGGTISGGNNSITNFFALNDIYAPTSSSLNPIQTRTDQAGGFRTLQRCYKQFCVTRIDIIMDLFQETAAPAPLQFVLSASSDNSSTDYAPVVYIGELAKRSGAVSKMIPMGTYGNGKIRLKKTYNIAQVFGESMAQYKADQSHWGAFVPGTSPNHQIWGAISLGILPDAATGNALINYNMQLKFHVECIDFQEQVMDL